jgi:hypothetical protein
LAKAKRINGWSKRLSPQQPQANESIDPKFWISMVRPVYLLSSRRPDCRTEKNTELNKP